MKSKHRYFLICGLGLVGILCLFPPYVGVQLRTGDNIRRSVGYHSVFFPPEPGAICTALFNDYGVDEKSCLWNVGNRGQFSAYIDTSRLLVQASGVIMIMIVVMLAFERIFTGRKIE